VGKVQSWAEGAGVDDVGVTCGNHHYRHQLLANGWGRCGSAHDRRGHRTDSLECARLHGRVESDYTSGAAWNGLRTSAAVMGVPPPPKMG
jgi:hypothetical protein